MRAPDVLLLNDDDLTYAKLRLDERSMATVVQHIDGFESSLARALCWAAAWDMLRDAELAARDYVALALTGLPAESDINLVTATLRQAAGALSYYSDPEWAPSGWAALADTARTAMLAAAPGSGFQLAWARAFAAAARSDEHLAVLRGWLSGDNIPAGLPIDTEFRWSLLRALVANGAADATEIEAELASDRTSSGEREAAETHALIPTAANKASVWRALTDATELPNWRNRALLGGFQHPAQVELIGAVRRQVLRVGRRRVGDAGLRAGAGVRGVRVPDVHDHGRGGRVRRRVAGPARPPGGVAPPGRRGPRRHGTRAAGPPPRHRASA